MEGTLSRIGQLLGMWMPKGIRSLRPMPQSQQTLPRRHHSAPMKLNDSIKIASELRAKGLSMNAIGQQLGVSRQRIHQILHSNIHMENERSKWTFGLSTRNIRIVQSLNLTTKQEVIDAISAQLIFPNMTKNFGIRSYFDLCEWANVQPPSNLTFPKRYHAIIHS